VCTNDNSALIFGYCQPWVVRKDQEYDPIHSVVANTVRETKVLLHPCSHRPRRRISLVRTRTFGGGSPPDSRVKLDTGQIRLQEQRHEGRIGTTRWGCFDLSYQQFGRKLRVLTRNVIVIAFVPFRLIRCGQATQMNDSGRPCGVGKWIPPLFLTVNAMNASVNSRVPKEAEALSEVHCRGWSRGRGQGSGRSSFLLPLPRLPQRRPKHCLQR
jgi:hypothetical protein